MAIIGGLSFPDDIDPVMDETDARNIIGRLGQVRKRGTTEDVCLYLRSVANNSLNIYNNEKKAWTMAQLLEFMKQSPYLSCKKAANNSMSLLFEELTDMQEQATDVVYDLCEDSEQSVNIQP